MAIGPFDELYIGEYFSAPEEPRPINEKEKAVHHYVTLWKTRLGESSRTETEMMLKYNPERDKPGFKESSWERLKRVLRGSSQQMGQRF